MRFRKEPYPLPVLDKPRQLPSNLQHCARLSVRLTVETCGKRYSRASAVGGWAGNAQAALYETCEGCPIGRANAARRDDVRLHQAHG